MKKSTHRRISHIANALKPSPCGAKLFKKLLVVNRGEIAIRIMRAAKAMGIPTVAIYAGADKDALHHTVGPRLIHCPRSTVGIRDTCWIVGLRLFTSFRTPSISVEAE